MHLYVRGSHTSLEPSYQRESEWRGGSEEERQCGWEGGTEEGRDRLGAHGREREREGATDDGASSYAASKQPEAAARGHANRPCGSTPVRALLNGLGMSRSSPLTPPCIIVGPLTSTSLRGSFPGSGSPACPARAIPCVENGSETISRPDPGAFACAHANGAGSSPAVEYE